MDDNSKKLREQAKDELRKGKKIDTSLYETDLKILVEELSIYQIELEHQNHELIQSQEQLHHSNERYLDLFDNAPVGYLIVDSKGMIKDINQTACLLLESSKQEFLENKITKIIHPDFQDIYYLYFRTLINQKHSKSCDIKLRKSNNSYFYARIQGNRQTQLTDNDPEFRLAVIDVTSQKEMELKLLIAKEHTEESEEKFRLSFMTSLDAFYISTLEDGKMIDVNHEMTKIFGYTREEIIGKTSIELNLYNDSNDRETMVAELKANGQIKDFEVIGRKKDGSLILVVLSASVTKIGSQHHIIGVLRDITKRKQAEILLKETSDRLKEVLENAIDASYKRNLFTNKYEYLSPAFEKIAGYFMNDINDLPIEEVLKLMHPDDIPETEKVIAEAMSDFSNNSHEVIYRFKHKKHGNYRWILDMFKIMRDSQDKPVSMIGSVSDITERKEAEEKLRESEERYSKMGNAAFDAIVLINDKGNIELWNPAAEKMFGYTKEEVNNKNVHQIITPERFMADHRAGWKKFVETGEGNAIGKVVELVGKRKTGEEFPVELALTSVEINNTHWALGYIRDITERKKTEQELITAKLHAEESDRLKSAFLANMSHEIRTPMNGILGFSELLKEPALTGEQQQEYISIIAKSGLRMLNIINDIIDISKIEAGLMKLDIKESNINEQIEYIYNFFKPEVEAKGMKLLFNTPLPAKEVTITTDNEKVYAILTNLVKNAIKYSKEGTIELGYKRMGDDIRFYVKDTGIGIPKDRQEAIFERFIQADIADKMARQGAGLGLSISKAYVEMLKGKIWVESVEGTGSTFYFTLPYNALPMKEIINQEFAVSDKTSEVKKLKFLIAEDDETSGELISIYIRKFGNEIIKVQNGKDAVNVFRNNPDIDLILMDIQMPEMNGYEATRQIRQLSTKVIVIALTAFALTGDREKAIQAGCNDYIAKPVRKDELLGLIQKYSGK
jgi:PAS domain S-box-containing protein